MIMKTLAFEQQTCDIGDFKIDSIKDAKGNVHIRSIGYDHEQFLPTHRFWKSFFQRFRISDNVFRYFSPTEVFERISRTAPNHQVRFFIERSPKSAPQLLAVTTPGRPTIHYSEVIDLVSRYDGTDIEYADGVITSRHIPRSGVGQFKVGGDAMENRFTLETPVDGFGHPKIHLSLLRLVCINGMVGYSKAFRSDISLGKDVGYSLTRALESYDNGEGYSALRQRIESSQTSWASIRDCIDLHNCLNSVELKEKNRSHRMLDDFRKMTGNLHVLYGLANLEAISTKRQRILPAKCRVYDLLNFASEVGTHYATENGNRTLQSYIGRMISDEYDMEGTAGQTDDFNDFFVSSDAKDTCERN